MAYQRLATLCIDDTRAMSILLSFRMRTELCNVPVALLVGMPPKVDGLITHGTGLKNNPVMPFFAIFIGKAAENVEDVTKDKAL
eukprot:1504952-Ditylum_brightwellii.AAC.1